MYTYFCELNANDSVNNFQNHCVINLADSSFSFWDVSRKRINKYGFSRINTSILDLLYISSFVYLADCSSPRSQTITNWERRIKLYIPVINIDLMNLIKQELTDALNFLSGDYWELEFRTRKLVDIENYQISKTKQMKIPDQQYDCISMLSGGLDSCIGAIDLLESNKKPLFVGCHGRGASVKPYQDKVFKALKKQYNIPDQCFKQFSLERKANGTCGELTTRSRSFYFFMFGIAMADIYNINELVIPENGCISLNIPLTWSRLGSSSTRTTHPYYLSLLNKMLNKLNSSIYLVNPYQFKTKGEMMCSCKNQALLREIASITMSCSHPSDRYNGVDSKKDSHCGYCVPCTIRRAAFKKAGIPDASIYRDPESEIARQNYKSFEIGMLTKHKFGQFEVLRSGPIPDVENFAKYQDLYIRSVEEIKDLLSKND